MTPTIEEVKRVADECGIIDLLDPFAIEYDGFYEKAQAFAQHYIEVGRKMQRESDAEMFDGQYTDSCPITNISKAIRNNTGE